MIINGVEINNFTEAEFSENIKYASPELIINLDILRDLMGYAINPSPVSGALARMYGSKKSQHYAVNRLSTAIDVFITCDPFEAYSKILSSKLFSRVGIYPFTYFNNKPHMMWHLDLRDNPLMWIREKNGKYIYNVNDIFYKKLYSYLKEVF